MRGLIFLGALLLGALNAARASACASCGCGDPTLTAMGFEKPFKHRIRIALETRGGLHADPSSDERTLISRTTLSVSYSPTAWLSAAAQLPFAAAVTEAPTRQSRSVYGLGDLELMVRVLPLRDRRFAPRHLAGGLVGLKFPTGPRRTDSTGYPAPEDMQPGSGSWDGLFGLGYSYFGSAVAFFFSLSYRLTSPGYRDVLRGASLGGTALLQVPLGRRLALQGGLEAGLTERTRLAPEVWAPNRGGFLLSLSYGAVLALRPDWLLRLLVQSPIVQHWVGSQWESPTAILSLAVDL